MTTLRPLAGIFRDYIKVQARPNNRKIILNFIDRYYLIVFGHRNEWVDARGYDCAMYSLREIAQSIIDEMQGQLDFSQL